MRVSGIMSTGQAMNAEGLKKDAPPPNEKLESVIVKL
jgi:hypothetical protein